MEFISEDIDKLYFLLAKAIMNKGNTVVSRNKEVKELISVSITLTNPSGDNFLKNKDRKLSLRYAFGELFWYLTGSDSLDFISYYAKSYSRFSDNKKILNGAYGPRLMPYVDVIVELLKSDPSTRRAVINIYNTSDIGIESNDVPCTVSLQFLIRNNKLILQTYMRSNDLYLGLPYDIFSFTFFQKIIAEKIGIKVGSYYHYVSSLHIYKKDYHFFSNITDQLDNSIAEKIPNLKDMINNLEDIKVIEEKVRLNKKLNDIDKTNVVFNQIIDILKGGAEC